MAETIEGEVQKAVPKKKAASKKKAARRSTSKSKDVAAIPEQLPQPAETQIVNTLMKSLETGTLQPEQLDMVLNAQERILDRIAKQRYADAMSACQAEMPRVIKSKLNKQTDSLFEDLGKMVDVIKPAYTSHGFAVSFKSTRPFEEGYIAMKAVVQHRDGWSEEHTIELPADNTGIKGNVNKTLIHGIASARSYMRRYLLREIFNLVTSEDQDTDGNMEGDEEPEYISEDQVMNLLALIDEVGADRDNFLKACRVDSLEMMTVGKYHGAVQRLEMKREKQA